MSASEVDLEQEVFLIDSATSNQQRFSVVRRASPLTMALALLCTAAFAFLPSPDAELQEMSRPSRLSGLIQAYALERGRALSEGEVQAIHTRVAERPKAQVLLSRFSSSDGNEKANALEIGLSDACADAIEEKLMRVLSKFAKALVDLFFDCILGDEESDECEDLDDKLENFVQDVLADCQASGDYCNISATDVVDGKLDTLSQAVCVPSECHEEVTKTIEFLKKEFEEEMAETPGEEEDQEGVPKKAATKEAGKAAEKSEMSKASDGVECANCAVSVKCASGTPSSQGRLKGDARTAAVFLVNMGSGLVKPEDAIRMQ